MWRLGWRVESSQQTKAAVTQMATGPRGADPHHLKKVLPVTLQRYRESLRPFVSFLLEHRFSPSTPGEWDDLFMEYKFEHTPRRAAFEATVAALEFANPRVKGGLPWCRATLAGWSVSDPIHHTVPLLGAWLLLPSFSDKCSANTVPRAPAQMHHCMKRCVSERSNIKWLNMTS